MGKGVKAEIYRRIEPKEGALMHMKRAGLIWLKPEEQNLGDLSKKLRDEITWGCKT